MQLLLARNPNIIWNITTIG